MMHALDMLAKVCQAAYLCGWAFSKLPNYSNLNSWMSIPSPYLGKRYKLKLTITEVNNPHDWWFLSFKNCWRKIIPNGNAYKCSHCSCTKEVHRYKLSLNSKYIKLNEEDKEVVGQFMFFGDGGTTITGHGTTLVAATTRGRIDYVPPPISSTVGRKCIIVADVTQDALDANNITFHVSRSEIINIVALLAATSSASKLSANSEKSTQLGTSEHMANPPPANKDSESMPTHMANPPPANKDSESTPTKDIIETTDLDPGELRHRLHKNRLKEEEVRVNH